MGKYHTGFLLQEFSILFSLTCQLLLLERYKRLTRSYNPATVSQTSLNPTPASNKAVVTHPSAELCHIDDDSS
jgi:hypothetical protein